MLSLIFGYCICIMSDMDYMENMGLVLCWLRTHVGILGSQTLGTVYAHKIGKRDFAP